MPNPPSDRRFMALFIDVDHWKSNQDGMVCLACAGTANVRQGARANGGRMAVWACGDCQLRYARLKRKGRK